MASLTRPAVIGASAVVTTSAVRWLNGGSPSLDTNSMVVVGVSGAGASLVAPSLASAVYTGTGRALVEAVMSGVVASGIIWLWTGDSSVAMHIPVQALAHIGGSAVAQAVTMPRNVPLATSPATSASEVADIAGMM